MFLFTRGSRRTVREPRRQGRDEVPVSCRDRGEGPVSYLVVVLLIAVVAVALAFSGIGGVVAGHIYQAVCKVAENGGLVDRCEPLGRQPGQPAQPAVNRPQNACYGTIGVRYGELTVTFPLRYFDIRGGIRIGVQYRKIITPGRPDRWDVTIYGWGEGSLATPSLPGSQADSDDPLGPSNAGGSSASGGLWAGLNLTGGETYSFGSEQEAKDFPWRYAEARARQLANRLAKENQATGPGMKLLQALPWVGDKVKRFIEGDPLPPRKEWFLEGGITAGFSGKLDLFDKAGFSVGGRGWHLMGVKGNDQGETTYTLKDAAEFEPSAVLDLGEFLPRNVRGRFNGRIDEAIDFLEKQASRKYGVSFKLPALARAHLKANWPDFGLTWKGKISVVYQLTTDSTGRLIRYNKIVDMQGNWSGRGAWEVTNRGKTRRAVGNAQYPLGGGRNIEQSSLDLTVPENLAAARTFFYNAALTWAKWPAGFQVGWSPEARLLDDLVDRKGTKTRLDYDSDVGNLKFTGEGKGKRGSSLAELKLEGEENALSNAWIWEDGRGWVPWTGCHA